MERKVGGGRVIVWASSLDDSHSDSPKNRAPRADLDHRQATVSRQAARAWQTIGQVVDVQSLTKSRANWVVVTPSGKRVPQSGPLELDEQGVYQIRPAGAADGFPPQAIAVNIDPAEEDLSTIDPAELVAAVTGHAAAAPAGALPTASEAEQIDIKEAERKQSFWWYLLVTGLLLLAAETVVSNRLSQSEKFL